MDTKTPLFDAAHCEPDSWESLDYEGKVLAMRPEVLKEEYRTGEFQLWLATGGFGCSPTAIGRAVYATCLADGEETRWDRADFLGVVKDEFLPDWAREKLEELQAQRQSGPTMGGMR